MRRFTALFLRELRDRIGLVLILSLCVPVLSIAVQWTWFAPANDTFTVQWLLPILLALVAGALGVDLGARDQEQGTDVVLARMPVGRFLPMAAKLTALVLVGSLLIGWILGIELSWRAVRGWSLEPLLKEIRQPGPLALAIPFLALTCCTMGLITGRSLTAIVAVALLFGGLPLALGRVAPEGQAVESALFAAARLSLSTWQITAFLALLTAAVYAFRPGRREPVRSFLLASAGALVVAGPVTATACWRAAVWRPARVVPMPSPDGSFVVFSGQWQKNTKWGSHHHRSMSWLTGVDREWSLPVRIEGRFSEWMDSGELRLWDTQTERQWALDPRTGHTRDLTVGEDPSPRWWSREGSDGEQQTLRWNGHELSILREEAYGFLRAVPTVPGLAVWSDRTQKKVFGARLDTGERWVLWEAREWVGTVKPSPFAPVVWVLCDGEPLYLHPETGEVLATPGGSHLHADWVDRSETFAVSHRYSSREESTFVFHGSAAPPAVTIEGRNLGLRVVGKNRLLTWIAVPGNRGERIRATLRELDGTPLHTLWE